MLKIGKEVTLFSHRKEIERELQRWCAENKLDVTPASMLAFFEINGFLNYEKVIKFLKGAE